MNTQSPQTNNVMAMTLVEQLIAYGRKYLSLPAIDVAWARNNLMHELHLTDRAADADSCQGELEDLVAPLVQYALGEGIIQPEETEHFAARLVSMVMPTPHEVMDRFDSICMAEGVRYATDWLYDLSQKSGYIPMKAIMRNPRWRYTGPMGDIAITINTAKPEKDPKAVAAAKAAPQTGYPKCMLCVENIGYYGRPGWPARSILRAIPLVLDNGDLWYMQYSPYSYFAHHCIFLNSKHQPMDLNSAAYDRMLDFVRIFPAYFVGSNAPLPIVGGSILAHDHYQGGAKVHPMFSRYLRRRFTNPAFPGVRIGVVDWYNSVIRVRCREKSQLVRTVDYISRMWSVYSDPAANIIAATGDTPHNCITPIFRMERGELYAELILRNNRTDEAHPYGIFHPTEDMHHIKKESIGIIEVLGTFILPGRLAAELDKVADILCGAYPFNEKELADPENPLFKHKEMIVELLKENGLAADKDAAVTRVRDYVSKVGERILNCTAVFKNTAEGQAQFDKFMHSIGCVDFVYRESDDAREDGRDTRPTASFRPLEDMAPVASVESPVQPVAASPVPAPTTEAPAEPVKRKRGRPRKNPLPQ